MNVLMGKVARTGGQILVNGVAAELYRFRKVIGYVSQDDVMLKELTVREVITFAAQVRLPRDWQFAEVKTHVDAILKVLK